MEISISPLETITVVSLAGEITTKTAPTIQEQILPLVTPHQKILLDMSNVSYMSSAGLRFLLSLYRQTTAQEGQLVLVGLSEEIADTMTITGFLNFFTTCNTLESGLTFLR
jgi:anti-sigma B factor antagonist